ncbi:hypothetical protein [Pseudomonas putida]|uniref:hypothetical protein n=1 Tax=Pseudomonas putida TaxID=303 RepID=UPI00114CA7F4|nr:hypothetical protein [Pseudomonas putida]
MRKDWVVWVGCVSLFASGVIWGRVPIPTDFFKIKDVHDLFEIAGSGATVLAVCLAAAGFSAWKLQILAASDHDLARRASIALHTYQAAVVRGSQVAEFLEVRVASEIGRVGIKPHQADGIRRELERLESATENVKALSLECKVVWGEGVWLKFQSALVPGEKYAECIEGYLLWSSGETSNTVKDKLAEQIADSFNSLIPIVGIGKASVGEAMDHALAPLYEEVQRKFLTK